MKTRTLAVMVLTKHGPVRLQAPLEEMRQLHAELGLMLASSDAQPDQDFREAAAFLTAIHPLARVEVLAPDPLNPLGGTPLVPPVSNLPHPGPIPCGGLSDTVKV